MDFFIFGTFLAIAILYWLFTIVSLKKLSKQFRGACSEDGIIEDTSVVDIVHRVIPAGYQYSINLRITPNHLCLIPTGIWGWIPPITIPFDQLTIVKYKEGILSVIELGVLNGRTRICIKGDGARTIKNTANMGVVTDAGKSSAPHTP